MFLLSGCTAKTTIKGYVRFNNQYHLVKEYENGEEVSTEDRWFAVNRSDLYVYPDYSYKLVLVFQDMERVEKTGNYLIQVDSSGTSGTGYIVIEGAKRDMTFVKHYFLIFSLNNYQDETSDIERTLYFQRWGMA